MNTVDQTSIKNHNQKLILQEIIKNYPISRAKLAKLTHLNKATISSQTASLIEKEIVSEIGTGSSSGGRKPILLTFNKNAGYAIGIDLGVDYLLTVLTDLEGTILISDYCEITDHSYESVASLLLERIHSTAEHAPKSPYGIVGIGVGVHGFVNRKQTVVFTPHSAWRDVDLKTFLEGNFECPIIIDNEANAGAYGEKLFGALKQFHNSIYISVGVGIGLGLIVDDKLYRGAEGFSGEMGHMTIDFNGKKCRCGNQGCWELYASEKAFYSNLAAKKNTEHLTLEQVSKMIQDNDQDTLRELESFGTYLGIGFTNIINTFNPEALVIRSNLIESNPIVLNSIQNTLASRVSKFVPHKHQLLISQLNRNATALGSASFMINNFLTGPELFN